jgi:hypothetical protein
LRDTVDALIQKDPVILLLLPLLILLHRPALSLFKSINMCTYYALCTLLLAQSSYELSVDMLCYSYATCVTAATCLLSRCCCLCLCCCSCCHFTAVTAVVVLASHRVLVVATATITATAGNLTRLLSVTAISVTIAVLRSPAPQLSLACTTLILQCLPLSHAVLVEHVPTWCYTLSSCCDCLKADAALISRRTCSEH